MFQAVIYTAVAILSIVVVVNVTLGISAWRRYRQMDPEEKALADFERELQVWDGRVPAGIVEEDDGQS